METPKKTKSSKPSKMECAKRSKRTWTAKPILSREIMEDPPQQQVYVGLLKDKRDISNAIPSISSAVPGFHHLKRCSWGRLLLAPLYRWNLSNDRGGGAVKEGDPLTEEELKSILKEKGFDISVLEDTFEIRSVPSRAPRTKAQAARASEVWPVNFHPEPDLERVIDGSIFEEYQLEAIADYMGLAIEAARLEAVGSRDCNGGAVIVDPEDGRILAIAASKIDLHPMWHASMIAVDLVAKLQGGGAWDLNDSKNFASPRATVFGGQGAIDAKETEHLIIRRRKYEEKAPLYYPKSLSELGLPASQSLLNSANVRKEGKTPCRTKKAYPDDPDGKIDAANPDRAGPYLCTGYWAFLFKEPCPLCAMALLHSRILRIFYSLPNEKTGVLGTNGILHAVPGLNHRYQVWSGILEEESRQAAGVIGQRDIS